ncbi:MAG: hypothetical protein J6V25_11025 [Oscillospiraceae bacterium]|nr:hypothetical protein [Oscillospiraceae bacterium]
MQSKRTPASQVALGGVMASLAVVIMCLGTVFVSLTYVGPVICCMILHLVCRLCGSRMGWAWFGATAVLSSLLAPNKEAALVFAAIGYYPIVKPRLDGKKLSWLWKLLLFNAATVTVYWAMIHLLGMAALAEEFAQAGRIMTAVTLAMGNVLFVLLDFALRKLDRRFFKK